MYRARAFQFPDGIPFDTANTTPINDCQASLGGRGSYPGQAPLPCCMSHTTAIPAVFWLTFTMVCANRADDAMVKNHFRRPRDLRQTSGASCECLLLGVAFEGTGRRWPGDCRERTRGLIW